MPRGYLSSETTVHFVNHHFVRCPNYIREVIAGELKNALRNSSKKR